MTLRKKTLLIISATTFGLILVLYVASQTILLGSFTKLEKRLAGQSIERAVSALSDEISALDRVVYSWAARDDIYALVRAPSLEYIQSNFGDETFVSFGLSLILLVDNDDQIIFGRAFDLHNERQVPVPESLQEHLAENTFLLRHADVESSVAGIVLLPEGPLLIASRPILTSEKEGPIRGTLIMGRYFDSAEIDHLAEATDLSLTLRRFDDSQMPSDFQAARSFFLERASSESAPAFVQSLNIESIAGYGLLKNIYGEPCLILRADIPREIYKQGQTSALYSLSALLGVSLVFGLLILLLLEKMILSRLTKLTSDVGRIGASGSLAARVSVSGEDELSGLAGTINAMLTALERRNRELTTLYEAATAISSDLSLDFVLQTVAEQATRALGSSGCALSLWNREENLVETLVDHSRAWPDEIDPVGTTYDLADYPATLRVLETGQPLVIRHDDPKADEAERTLMKKYEAYTLLMLPLIAHDRVLGLMELIDDVEERDYTPREIHLAESLVVHAAVAIENARLYEQAQQQIVERKQAEEAMRESEQRFRDVARTTGDWIWEMDAKGRYTYTSPVVERVLGYTPAEVVGRYHADFHHASAQEKLGAQMQESVRKQRAIVRLASPAVHKDGHEVILETSSLPMADASGNLLGYRGVHRDITAERRLKERLDAVHILGRVLALSMDEQQVADVATDAAKLLSHCLLCGLWLVDREREVVFRQIAKATGQVSDIAPIPLDSEQDTVASVVRTGEMIYLPDVQVCSSGTDSDVESHSELYVPLRSREQVIGVLNIESGGRDVFAPEEQQLFLTLADQTALAIENARLYGQMRVAHDRLQTLSRRLVEAQETERRYLARELHDEVGQILTGLKLILEMSNRLPANAIETSLEEARGLVDELIAHVRNLSLDLRPTMLDDLGLLPALLWYFERYTSRTDVQVVFKHTGLERRRFAPEVETSAYRIVQEALTNVARHAGVSEVTVRIWADQDTLGAQIEDQGVGFDPEVALDGGTTGGLSGMHERAVLLDGQLTIESAPGAGTRLTAEFLLR